MPQNSPTTADELAQLLVKDWCHLLDAPMDKIRHCLDQLDDEQVWWRPKPSMNSVGNLLLHVSGNLRQWGIVGVKNLTDTRDREWEFTAADGLSRQELLEKLTETVTEAQQVFSELSPTDLMAARRIQGFDLTVLQAIGHTVTHFTGHTHQVIMLTRMMLGDEYRFAWGPNQPRTGVPA